MVLIMPLVKSKTTPEHSWRFEAIGTRWEIVSADKIKDAIKEKIEILIEEFDQTYSRFRAESTVRVMSENAGTYELPTSAKDIFNFYDDLWGLTNHKVTPMVGVTLESAGYGANYSLKPDRVIKKAPNYKQVVRRSGSRITISEPALIDIGAVGKGYLVDQITNLLQNEGYTSFLVDGSGDLRVVEKSERVGLESPSDTARVIGTVELSNRALCASAVNRRSWGEWHHIIDPELNRPVEGVVATWVIADTAMVADGLATALFFSSPQDLAERYTYEYVRLHSNGSVEYSELFLEGLFI